MEAGGKDEAETALIKDFETRFMNQLDEQILHAEEREMMARYDANIRKAEIIEQRAIGSAVLKDKDTWSDMDDEGEEDETPSRRRRKLWNAKDEIEELDHSSIEGMEYVKATKLIPRNLGQRLKTRKEVEQYFVKKFRKHEGASLQPVDWMGFRIRLQSANPNSWRLVATGYRKTVNLLLIYLAGMFRKHIVASKKALSS